MFEPRKLKTEDGVYFHVDDIVALLHEEERVYRERIEVPDGQSVVVSVAGLADVFEALAKKK